VPHGPAQRLTGFAPRLGPLTGLLGAVIYTVSAFTAGTPLKPDASRQAVIVHFSDKRGAVLAGFLLADVGVALLLWFLGYLHKLVRNNEGAGGVLATITLAAWVSLLVIAVAGAVPVIAVVWRGAGQVSPGIVGLAFDVSNLSLYSLSATVAAVSVLAPIIVIWRSRCLTRWLVALGIVVIVVNGFEIAGVFVRTGFDAGGYAGGVGPFLWVLWVAVLSVAMVLRPEAAETIRIEAQLESD
jgi:hypothetical protein